VLDQFHKAGYTFEQIAAGLAAAFDWAEAQVNAIIDDLKELSGELADWFCSWIPWC
jgi:hypothetical protein